jgi:hypothetical protein
MLSHWKLKLHTNLHPLRIASCRTWAQRILHSSHLFKNPQLQHVRAHIVNRRHLTQQQADFHSLQLNAKLGIHQKYKYKLPNTLQPRRAAGMRRLYPPICAGCSKREDNWYAKLKNFFNAKTYTPEHTSNLLEWFFRRFTKSTRWPDNPYNGHGHTNHMVEPRFTKNLTRWRIHFSLTMQLKTEICECRWRDD